MRSESEHSPLTRFAWLSVAAAIVTIGLKLAAYRLTGSVGLLSDAIESVVNLVGGMMALAMLTVAARPADEDHPYGHGKAEYFSSGVASMTCQEMRAGLPSVGWMGATSAIRWHLHPGAEGAGRAFRLA